MKSRGLLGSLASMLALVGLNFGSPAEVEPPPVTIPRPGEALAPPQRRGGGWPVGFVFRDDPEALARVNAIRTPVNDAEAMDRAERKRARVAITRRGLRVVVGPRAAEASS
jgi:hypothetical protein